MKDFKQEIDRILAEADAMPEGERRLFLRREIGRLRVEEHRDDAAQVKSERSGTTTVRQALEAAAESGPAGTVSWTPAGIPWFGTIEQLVHLHECLSAAGLIPEGRRADFVRHFMDKSGAAFKQGVVRQIASTRNERKPGMKAVKEIVERTVDGT